MGSSADLRQTWAAFELLMRIRMLIACLTILLLPPAELTPVRFLLVVLVALLCWLASSNGELIVRRLTAHPVLAVLDVAVSFAVLGIGGPSGPFLLFTVITTAIAGLLYQRPGMLAVSALQIGCYYLVLLFGPAGPGPAGFQVVVGQPVYYPLAGFAGVALRRLFEQQAIAVAERERTWLAREMHDSLAKTLRGISLSAATLPVWVSRDPDRAVREAGEVAAAAELAAREAHSLMTGLRDASMTLPLPVAVREQVARWRVAQGIPVRCEVADRADVPLRVRYELVAILAEALTNIERHAAARQVEVRLAVDEHDVVLTVTDDGAGFLPAGLDELRAAGHFGIVGLHERAQRSHGTVIVRSRPGQGTTVTARVPAADSMGPTGPAMAEAS